jgi:site-specific DNA recombinase
MSTRTAIYVRISLDKGGSALGVERQEKECRKKADILGWDVAKVYVDNDKSASKVKVRRPGYEQMLADIESGLIDAVLIWDLDRLVRRPMELEQFMELVDRKGVKLANWTGDIDLATSSGVLMARIKGALAAQEVRRLGERVQAQAQQRAEMGLPPKRGRFGRTYGYTPEWQIVPEEAAVIREVYDRVLNRGETVWAVMHWLRDSGIPTLGGGTWTRSGLNGILDNPTYAALRRWHGEIIETSGATWPAIVEPETFYAWKTWREANGGSLDNHNKVDPVRKYLLTGIARCGVCTGPLNGSATGAVRKDGKRSVKLVCLSASGGCGKVLRSMGNVDDFVLEAFFREVERDNPKAVLVSGDHEAEIGDLERQVEQYRTAHEDKAISLGDFIRFAKPLNERLQALRKAQVKAAKEEARPKGEGIREAFAVASLAMQREMLRDRIDAVVILPVGRGRTTFDPDMVKIVWRERAQSANAA